MHIPGEEAKPILWDKTPAKTKTIFPIWEWAKNKVEKSEKFLAPHKGSFSHHVSPRIHHDLTIEKPRSNAHFSQTPRKNASKNAKIPRRHQRKFFLEIL